VDCLGVPPLTVSMRRLRSPSGQSTVEFGATIAWVLIAALAAWQLALVGWTAVSAANTARTVARLYSRQQNESQAKTEGYSSLRGDGLGTGASVSYDGTKWSVTADVPIVVPGIAGIPITQTAAIPTTG
jgi:membrane protein implicated in regulation of membrane protease activity